MEIKELYTIGLYELKAVELIYTNIQKSLLLHQYHRYEFNLAVLFMVKL